MRAAALALFWLAAASPLSAQSDVNRYDDTFRKYTKRYFGIGYDWRVFKAQGMTESNLKLDAKSWVGARGLMQLMPGTYKEIQSKNSEFGAIDDPEWNIAAGIYYDRKLWTAWDDPATEKDRQSFMFGSYNAGRSTLLRAQTTARARRLDDRYWSSIEAVAPKVTRWRHTETLGYIRRIDDYLARMDHRGGVGPERRMSTSPAPTRTSAAK